MKRNALALVALMAAIFVSAQCRAEQTLKIGDAAPALSVSKWIKGEPVAKLEKGKIYVVEFWATWCGPCRATIPHLSKMQQEYKDVVFIGQDCWEQDQSAAEPFVKQMGDKMNYRVALDNMEGSERGQMAEKWMAAAGRKGIPSAFLVDKDTKIAWVGHPMQLEDVLKGVIAGTFDPKKAADAEASKMKFANDFQKALEGNDLDKALQLIDSQKSPELVKQLQVQKYMILMEKKDHDAAFKLGAEIVTAHKDEPQVLNAVAWSLVDPENPPAKTDLALAEKAALAANAAAGGKAAAILDTVARVYKLKGDLAKAIEFQTKAVEHADDEESKTQLKKALDEYKAEKK